jgi:hypothetical protein
LCIWFIWILENQQVDVLWDFTISCEFPTDGRLNEYVIDLPIAMEFSMEIREIELTCGSLEVPYSLEARLPKTAQEISCASSISMTVDVASRTKPKNFSLGEIPSLRRGMSFVEYVSLLIKVEVGSKECVVVVMDRRTRGASCRYVFKDQLTLLVNNFPLGTSTQQCRR